MKVVSSPRYAIDIGPHVFPTEKYRRIYDRLLATPRPGLEGIIAPQAAAWDELALVHTAEYLDAGFREIAKLLGFDLLVCPGDGRVGEYAGF